MRSMADHVNDAQDPANDPESRWPAAIAVLAVLGLYAALPPVVAVGPRWLAPVVIGALLIVTKVTHHQKRARLNQLLGHLLSAAMTLFMIWSLVLLLQALPSRKEQPATLLRSAGALWLTNWLVFASWYWRLDAGGPHARDARPGHERGAFLFPQMMLSDTGVVEPGWSPLFIDYLFLAFNTSTAFSPTDVPVLDRWAKVLTMIQAMISLATIALLAARAVNIL